MTKRDRPAVEVPRKKRGGEAKASAQPNEEPSEEYDAFEQLARNLVKIRKAELDRKIAEQKRDRTGAISGTNPVTGGRPSV